MEAKNVGKTGQWGCLVFVSETVRHGRSEVSLRTNFHFSMQCLNAVSIRTDSGEVRTHKPSTPILLMQHLGLVHIERR